ncbi:MAG: hypothetical protein KBT06_11550 [Prevotellaceae bacterium]|nr:hypothetical protein [Candidatus Colivivens equi]
MANNHGYAQSTLCSCWNVDSMNIAGVYADGDVDNGTIVVLDGMNIDATTGKVKGYEYKVAMADASSKSCWIIESPEVGRTLEQQMMSDPRYFYNEAGKGFSLKYLHAAVDCWEFDAHCFASGTLPTVEEIGYFVPVGANGKLGAPVASEPAGGCYFRVEALKDVAVGQGFMTVAILRCMAN